MNDGGRVSLNTGSDQVAIIKLDPNDSRGELDLSQKGQRRRIFIFGSFLDRVVQRVDVGGRRMIEQVDLGLLKRVQGILPEGQQVFRLSEMPDRIIMRP